MDKHVDKSLMTIVIRRDTVGSVYAGWRVTIHQTTRKHIQYSPNVLDKCAVSVKGGVCA